MLYIVGTPIGNLKDITLRAIEVLKKADIILAEDTRRAKILLDHYGIKTNRLVSFHEHSSPEKIDWVIRELKSGKEIALVSDAGTPGVADPGGRLVESILNTKARMSNAKSMTKSELLNNQIRHSDLGLDSSLQVVPIPGPSALTTIMSISGIQNEPCLFVGYLPKKKGRETLLKKLGELEVSFVKTIVILESPQRISRTIKDLHQTFSLATKLVVGRELTKQFEEVVWTTLDEAIKRHWPVKGEYVLLLSP